MSYFTQITHTPVERPFSGTTRVSLYQKGKTNLDFTEARDSEWQWHQLGHMQVCISLQTDNHASTPPLKFFLQAGCPSCHPTNSVKALKAYFTQISHILFGDWLRWLLLRCDKASESGKNQWMKNGQSPVSHLPDLHQEGYMAMQKFRTTHISMSGQQPMNCIVTVQKIKL